MLPSSRTRLCPSLILNARRNLTAARLISTFRGSSASAPAQASSTPASVKLQTPTSFQRLQRLPPRRAFASISETHNHHSHSTTLPPTLPAQLNMSSLPTSSAFPPCPPIPTADGPVNLILPPTEDRPHRYLRLPNGLEVILVSDPKADKSAASMDVGVGHLSDPEDLPGCAHFCEHLLFMGTKKYPAENAYSQYLSSHNGQSNAYTAMTSTVYYFDVGADALEGALDRFAGFFIEPLFNEDCTEREIKAVDSEHKKNIQSDMWRFFQLEKHVFRHDHPYHKFGTGNYKSLWSIPKSEGRDPRQQLISWWEKYYCARRMKLAVAGKEDLDTLEKWVRERFEGVPVRSEGLEPVGPEGVRIAITENPIGPEQMQLATFTKPVQDTRGLEITFPFPDLDHLYQSKPAHYITHFIGHEGRGSVLSYLKKQGWVNQLRAGLQHGAAGFEFMKITVDLTPSGLEHWKDVALAMFKYMNLLRSQPPSSVAFDEIKAIADISFKFAEKSKTRQYATALASMMQRPLPREKIVSGGSLLEDFRPEEVVAALQLMDPRMATIGVTTRDLPKEISGGFDKTEPIYGTEYKQIKLPEEFIKEALNGKPIADLQLPGKNLFIPERLDVEKFDTTTPLLRPDLLRDSELSRLWYKRDDTFWLPRTNVYVTLHSPILNNTPRNAVLARLFCDLFTDSITEDTYDATLAELNFNLWYGGETLGFGAGGFSDKLAVLLETMLNRLMVFEIDPTRFEGVVDEIKLNWKNFPLSDPYRQIGYWNSYAITQVVWTQEEKLKELEVITPADVKAFGKEILSRLYIETLIHGNTSPHGAQEIQDMVERVLKPRALAVGERNNIRTLTLPKSSEHVWSIDIPNKSEVNSAIVYGVQIGHISDRALRAALQLFAQITSEPAFNQLRTKEQLGYIVDGSATQTVGVMGYRFLVQSERDPVYVETRIEAFLDWLKTYIEEMSEEDFAKNKQALISKKEEKPKNLGEETRRFWSAVSDGFYEFAKRQTDIDYLRNTTKQDVLDLLLNHIHPSSPTRAKLSTHMRSQYRGIKFDLESAQPLIEGFTKHNISVDQVALQKLMASQPDLQTVKDFAISAVEGSKELGEEAKKELEEMINGLKGKEAGTHVDEKDAGSGAAGGGQNGPARLRPNNVLIEDIHIFKAGLIPSTAPIPLEPIKPLAKL